jgi:hypothetical protein
MAILDTHTSPKEGVPKLSFSSKHAASFPKQLAALVARGCPVALAATARSLGLRLRLGRRRGVDTDVRLLGKDGDTLAATAVAHHGDLARRRRRQRELIVVEG